ncbi:MAG TPA: isoprenoid biosynthesis glyoxalase ElbB, partial [Planctomycetota bacterium]|nr:isoprenoid biosynthesis glyoxalase ElbB [Planctomycetota bacterium]
LDRAGAEVTIAAPVIEIPTIDHRTGLVQGQPRNCVAESARIARGKISELWKLSPLDFDALVMPGGYGAAKTLCDFESRHAAARVHPILASFVLALHLAQKPIGAICIAPAIVAAVLRDNGISARLSFGNDPQMASTLRAMGQESVDCAVDECAIDEQRRIVCTPAYMYDARISEVAKGIDKLVAAVMRMAAAQAALRPRAPR